MSMSSFVLSIGQERTHLTGRGTGVAGANIYGDVRLLEFPEPRRSSLSGTGKDGPVAELTD